jgi:hypothetical protein
MERSLYLYGTQFIVPDQMGILAIVVFRIVMKILNFLKSKPAQPTIDNYGQTSSGLEQQQIQSIMEWLESKFAECKVF